MVRGLKQKLKQSRLARTAYLPGRIRLALSYYRQPSKEIVRWLLRSRERINLTYQLTDLNKDYLAQFLAVITGVKPSTVRGYFEELLSDKSLNKHLTESIKRSPRKHESDAEARFARRLGWYALVRILRPKIVIETGVDKGLGSCVLCAALLKNRAEGFTGSYFGTDIDPTAGFLLQPPYSDVGKVLYGDSIETLRAFDQKIDLFINDSDHSAEYEGREYETVQSKLSESATIIGDNAHVSGKLMEFAEKMGMQFLYFQEKPEGHWYPGGGIGVAFRTK